jgi:hypothetical protein
MIVQVTAHPDGSIESQARGELSPAEFLFALEDLKRQLFHNLSKNQPPLIPGMLRADGRRVPS